MSSIRPYKETVNLGPFNDLIKKDVGGEEVRGTGDKVLYSYYVLV